MDSPNYKCSNLEYNDVEVKHSDVELHNPDEVEEQAQVVDEDEETDICSTISSMLHVFTWRHVYICVQFKVCYNIFVYNFEYII